MYSSWLLRPASADESISEPEFATHWHGVVITIVAGEVSRQRHTKGVYAINRTQSAEVWAGPRNAIHNPQQRVQQPTKLGVVGYRERSVKFCTQWITGVGVHLVRSQLGMSA